MNIKYAEKMNLFGLNIHERKGEHKIEFVIGQNNISDKTNPDIE